MIIALIICIFLLTIPICMYLGYALALWRLYKVLETTWVLQDRLKFRYVLFDISGCERTIGRLIAAAAEMEDDLK